MPVFDFACECGWTGEMLVRSGNDAPPVCPGCGRPTKRLFSPTRALFIAEWARSENVDALRAMKARMEKDPQLRERERRAGELAAGIAEELRRDTQEVRVSNELLQRIVDAGRTR